MLISNLFLAVIFSCVSTLCVLVQPTITNHHRLGGLSNKHLSVTYLAAGKSKIKMLADVVSGEGLLSCS